MWLISRRAGIVDKNDPFWTFTLNERRALMGVADKKSYERWFGFRTRVLDPALEQVNDSGTVEVSMSLEKRGRSIHAVMFRWRWKDPQDASDTARENDPRAVRIMKDRRRL